ncbi:MAG: glycosyltransferase [Candidatus Berkiellales bacterium]
MVNKKKFENELMHNEAQPNLEPVYDYLFVTHLPAFYKVNLYHELAKRCRVFVIFIGASSVIRNGDFTQNSNAFDYCILNSDPFEKRSVLSSLLKLYKFMRSKQYRKVVVGGWDLPEFWWVVLFSPKQKNTLALESSIYESKTKGLAGILKKCFLSRVSAAFSSGKPQHSLLKQLNYSGLIKITKGVGIFNHHLKRSTQHAFQGKFLYVGRLATEKNLWALCEAFRDFPQYHLTLIGQGPLQKALQANKPANVELLGYVENEALGDHYLQHDVFILPSLREPWGLVVEEALYCGLPVIVSNKVGSGPDLIETWQSGLTFDVDVAGSLQQAITHIAKHYDDFVNNVKAVNFQLRDQSQIQQYLDVLS